MVNKLVDDGSGELYISQFYRSTCRVVTLPGATPRFYQSTTPTGKVSTSTEWEYLWEGRGRRQVRHHLFDFHARWLSGPKCFISAWLQVTGRTKCCAKLSVGWYMVARWIIFWHPHWLWSSWHTNSLQLATRAAHLESFNCLWSRSWWWWAV